MTFSRLLLSGLFLFMIDGTQSVSAECTKKDCVIGNHACDKWCDKIRLANSSIEGWYKTIPGNAGDIRRIYYDYIGYRWRKGDATGESFPAFLRGLDYQDKALLLNSLANFEDKDRNMLERYEKPESQRLDL